MDVKYILIQKNVRLLFLSSATDCMYEGLSCVHMVQANLADRVFILLSLFGPSKMQELKSFHHVMSMGNSIAPILADFASYHFFCPSKCDGVTSHLSCKKNYV